MSSHPMIPVPQALRTVLTETASAMIERGPMTEIIPISEEQSLLGRVAAQTLKASEIGYPPYNASIMDGYAVNIDEIEPLMSTLGNSFSDHDGDGRDGDMHFHVCDKMYAGPAKSVSSHSDEPIDLDMAEYLSDLPKAIYVTTGAVVPPPYNVVVPVEEVGDCDGEHDVISIHIKIVSRLQRNAWIRPIGCDIRPHSTILEKGEAIESVHIGLLIQCGIQSVKVKKMTNVGVLSTGNELVSHRESKETSAQYSLGIIPDANGPVLCSLLETYGNCIPKHLGIVKDDEEERLTSVLDSSMKDFDVLITTGGISMGEMDVIEKILVQNLGCAVHFGRLHMKPGKPTTFLTVNREDRKCLIFALPGNPVSSMVCTELLIRPCLDMLHQGSIGTVLSMIQNAKVNPEITAQLTNNVKLDNVRPEYHRVTLKFTNGISGMSVRASSTGVQRSSRLMSMREADGFMLLPQAVQGGKLIAAKGESYPVLLTSRPFGNSGFFSGVKAKDSKHLGGAPLTFGIIEVAGARHLSLDDNIYDFAEFFMNILGRDRFIMVEKHKSNIESCSDRIRSMNRSLDIVFVVGIDMSWTESMGLSTQLKKLIHKEAKTMAQIIRDGAILDDPFTALFEPMVGMSNYDPSGTLIISLPGNSIESVLTSIRGLSKQILSLARESFDLII